MSHLRPQRPSADSTRHKILQAALTLFMEQGFAGTSMAKLAEKAGVNQALIFHHFGNKMKLWRQVKATIIEHVEIAPINPKPESVRAFISDALTQHALVYERCPPLAKLISWQRIESEQKKEQLTGIPNSIISPETWLEALQYLRDKNLLNPNLNLELIMMWMVVSINGMVSDDISILKKEKKQKEIYMTMLIDTLSKGFAV
jgi:AcrR family transcriptional regulator